MKRIVIIGGGFAGTAAARELENSFEVTLIDTKNYFEFTPGILRTVVDTSHMRKIQSLHNHYLHKTRLIIGKVISVSTKAVQTESESYPYDYLIIASGSSYNAPIKEEGIVIATRAQHLREHHSKLEHANSVLIIGGGVVGVELAAEIIEHYPKKQITIVHAKDRLIERNQPRAIAYATAFLTKRGVKVRYNERVVGTEGDQFITDLGNRMSADMTFMCTGIVPNYEFMKAHLPQTLNERNLIKVNEFLQVENLPHVFAVGDVNSCPVEKTAQNAKQQAQTAAHNIRARENKLPFMSYRSPATPMVISLGKWNGIFAHKKFVFTGILPGLMKSLIEKKEMLRYR